MFSTVLVAKNHALMPVSNLLKNSDVNVLVGNKGWDEIMLFW